MQRDWNRQLFTNKSWFNSIGIPFFNACQASCRFRSGKCALNANSAAYEVASIHSYFKSKAAYMEDALLMNYNENSSVNYPEKIVYWRVKQNSTNLVTFMTSIRKKAYADTRQSSLLKETIKQTLNPSSLSSNISFVAVIHQFLYFIHW